MTSEANTHQRSTLAIVSACFLLSGFAALLYQTAWMRQLSTVFGTSELAVATVLAAYMAGLAFGALVAARYVDRIKRPVLVYGALEGAIAVSALAVPWLLVLASVLYGGLLGGQPEPPDASGLRQSLFYLLATFLILAIPTACMGATLPILIRYAVQSDEQVGPVTGYLYAINTFGAIAGTLVAAFLLLPAMGLMGTIAAGAFVNLIVFAIAALLSRRTRPLSQHGGTVTSAQSWGDHGWILPVMLVSGVASFVYEVLWTRLLSHILGGSVIAFATMLASFLGGIAIGSMIASRFAKTRDGAQLAFVLVQVGIAATSVLVYLALNRFIPETAGFSGNVPLAIAMLLPSTLFIGATYPLAVRILSTGQADAPRASALVYSWNTVGAIIGAIVAGFFLIPQLRFEGTISLAVAANLILAIGVAFVIPPRRMALTGACAILLLATFVGFRPSTPESLLRVSPLYDQRTGEIRFYDVGRSATVLMLEQDGFFYLRSNGLPEASTAMRGSPPARHSQRMLAALPVIARPATESMLVVGLGGGVVAEAIPSTIKDIDIVELEPKVVEANRAIAAERNIDPLADERINIIINDARNALRLSDKRYDAIVSQPSHPWTAGASHLYTREFMELVKTRLSEDGVFLQWMNTRFVDEALLRSLIATLADVFPYTRAYHFEASVLFFLASEQPIDPELDLAAARESQILYTELRRKGIGSINDVAAALAWDSEGMTALAVDAPLITDNNNLMAMRSARIVEANSLPYGRLKALIAEHGPLYRRNGAFLTALSDAIDFAYVSDWLTGIYAEDLSLALAYALENAGHPDAAIIGAKVLLAQGRLAEADQLLLAALEKDASNAKASYLLLRDRRESVVANDLPLRIRPFVAALPLAANAVIRNWGASARGDINAARAADNNLAWARSHDQWYLDAVKLRADWRIRAAQRGESAEHAVEAMRIIDDAIAVRQDTDLFGMRVAAAYLADDYDACVETARRMISAIRSDIEFRRDNQGLGISSDELADHAVRIRSLGAGLEIVRASGRIAQYKFDDLDERIDELQQLLRTVGGTG